MRDDKPAFTLLQDNNETFFITLSYDGENYCGWQIQPNAISVQQSCKRHCQQLCAKI